MIRTDSYIQSTGYNGVNKTASKGNNKNVNKNTNTNRRDEIKGVNSETDTEKTLSNKAQELLEKLQKKYTNMDFMVADFANGDDAKSLLSQGTKEFSVLFSSEELEKMASDEKYLEEKIKGMEGAVRFSQRINDEFGYESTFQKNSDGVEVTNVGISFNEDGTMTYFAELEKTNAKQQERLEDKKEAADDKKTNDEDKVSNTDVKRTIVQAANEEDLYDMIYSIDWSKINGAETIQSKFSVLV